ncbi:unnamed protein product [Toxocara canis]|uniref:Uncharacterized protein n=1 Tax=Toxocara canis TaxID=6265 RepID=A0A183VG78_TOXCA|nr:unnamed protein product [Toxocara canis]
MFESIQSEKPLQEYLSISAFPAVNGAPQCSSASCSMSATCRISTIPDTTWEIPHVFRWSWCVNMQIETSFKSSCSVDVTMD